MNDSSVKGLKFRLIGVNKSETLDHRKPVEFYGKEAWFSLLLNSRIVFERRRAKGRKKLTVSDERK